MKSKELKKKLRRDFLSKRENLAISAIESASAKLVNHLRVWFEKKPFKKVFLFFPNGSEPRLLSLVEELSSCYRFSLPVVKANKQMDFYSWKPSDTLAVNIYGIKEPQSENCSLSIPDEQTVVIVPGLGFDLSGNRLGVGGGYYDRYFARFPSVCKVGAIFSFQCVKKLPSEEKDVKVDHIFTENEQVL